jgi:hypothetical protein
MYQLVGGASGDRCSSDGWRPHHRTCGANCIWCLLNQNEHTTEPEEGELYVFPFLDDGEIFSWSQYDDGSAAGVERRATTESNGYAIPEQMNKGAPWAFFDLASNCRG